MTELETAVEDLVQANYRYDAVSCALDEGEEAGTLLGDELAEVKAEQTTASHALDAAEDLVVYLRDTNPPLQEET